MRKIPLTSDQTAEVERRLIEGESLRSIALSMDRCYQSLQYWRERNGHPKLRAGRVSGRNHPNWKGGELIDSWGYHRVYAPNRGRAGKYTYEHVIVAEKKIGRLLNKNEHVHHIDANKLNNHPDNLLVLSPSEHRHLHRSLEELALELVGKGEIIFRDGKYQWK